MMFMVSALSRISALRVKVASPERRTKNPLDHAEESFDLPTLSVKVFVEMGAHEPAPVCAREAFGEYSVTWWNNNTDAELLSGKDMRTFTIVSCIAE